jgi:S1-C subfamily serine protease
MKPLLVIVLILCAVAAAVGTVVQLGIPEIAIVVCVAWAAYLGLRKMRRDEILERPSGLDEKEIAEGSSTINSRVFSGGPLILLFSSQCLTAVAAPQPEVPTVAQCNELIESTLPSIVQLNYHDRDGKRHCYGCGVIVSPEGHVVASGMVGSVLDNVRLQLQLTDGRQVLGEALGWSSEFNVGMFKITEPGEWPFVRLSEQIQAGDVCLSLGYSLESAQELKNDRPEARLSVVGRVGRASWFTTPRHTRLTPHPVFNLNGELIGLARGDESSSRVGELVMHLSASVIRQQWNDLGAGFDLDRTRLLEQTKPPVKWETLPEKMSHETLDKIKAASVQIGGIGEKPSFSGVIVQDGFIVTCAHHHRLPGTKFNVVLADGRSIVATLVNTNWLADIGVLKVASEEELPFVNFGYSGRLSPEDTVVTIGYPHREKKKAIVLETKLAKFRTAINFRERVGAELYSAGENEEIAKGLSGVSGGGVFDSAGNLIGIHKGLISAGAGFQHRIARIELFRRNWEDLVVFSEVEEIESDKIASICVSLNKLMSELTTNDREN